MHASTFYAPPDDIRPGEILLRKDEAHHLRVSRHRPGDIILVADGLGQAYECRIAKVAAAEVIAEIVRPLPDLGEPAFALTLAVALPKRHRLEWIIEKGTEIGVRSFAPVTTSRTVAKTTRANSDRLRKVALAAMKQSCRSRVPEIHAPSHLTEILRQGKLFEYKMIAHEQNITASKAASTSNKTTDNQSRTGIVLIGPEGGFTDDEVELALAQGWEPLHMGSRRLRVDTAALVAAALLLHREGELG